jgi:cytochrome oxidase Cu insertion factor (SCO1/SenC/PrrC family)
VEENNRAAKQTATPERKQAAGRWKLFAVILICASPIIASYLTYYVIKPESRTNYGSFIDPREYPIPQLGSTTLDGKPTELEAYKGKWIMLQVANAACNESCIKKMHDMRQLRLAQGKEMDRVERVWMITDDKPLDTMLIREYEGTRMLRANVERVKAWLPVDDGTSAFDHIYMIDPLGNLMMRFPKDADPNKIKKDLSKLLKASSIG